MEINLSELRRLSEEATEAVSREPTVIEVDAEDVIIIGDTHGDYETTRRALSSSARLMVFLGDYVDRGPQQLENIIELMNRKISEPRSLILLRGNHETRSMNLYYGFYDQVRRRLGAAAYGLFAGFFAYLPLAAILRRECILLHGGVPENAKDISAISGTTRGEEDVTDPVALQVLWNDPSTDVKYFGPSPRGAGARIFGEEALKEFLERSHARLLIRSHEPVPDGHEYLFGGRLLTVFSCRFYGIRPGAALIRGDEVRGIYVDDLRE